jgi:hypothetical protein
MNKEWLSKLLLSCVPGILLAGLGYALTPTVDCCWDGRSPDLFDSKEAVEYYRKFGHQVIQSALATISILGGLVAGVVLLCWVGIRRKRVSPTGIWLLVFCIGVLVWRSSLDCSGSYECSRGEPSTSRESIGL